MVRFPLAWLSPGDYGQFPRLLDFIGNAPVDFLDQPDGAHPAGFPIMTIIGHDDFNHLDTRRPAHVGLRVFGPSECPLLFSFMKCRIAFPGVCYGRIFLLGERCTVPTDGSVITTKGLAQPSRNRNA